MAWTKDLGKHSLIVLSILFFTSLLIALTRNFLKIDMLLFESIIVSSSIIFLIVFLTLTRIRLKVIPTSSLQTLLYVSLIGLLCTLIILPNTLLNVDRSRSLYILNWVNQKQLKNVGGELVVNVKSPEGSDLSGVELRLDEQIQRGLVIYSGGEYKLSRSGRFVLQVAEILASSFNLSNWQRNKS